MRTFILLLAAMFVASASLAQKIQIGAYYLPQKTSISNSLSDKGDPIYKNKITFAGGGGVNFTFWLKSIGIQTGLAYISHNQKFVSEYIEKNEPRVTHIVTGKKRLDYLKLPLFLTYSNIIPYKRDSRLSFTTFGGPQFGYLLKGAGAVVSFNHYEYSDFYDLPPSGSDFYNKYIIDLVIGAGLDFHVTKELTINTALRYDWSISDVENKSATTNFAGTTVPHYYLGDPDRNKSHNNSIGLLLGVTYAIGGDHLLNPSRKW